MDLLQSFLGTTIQFKLHDVDILLGFQHEIHASLGSVVLDFRVETDQFEDDEKHVLIMPFLLADQFVRSIGQEAFQSIKKASSCPARISRTNFCISNGASILLNRV